MVDGIVEDLDPLYERPARRIGEAWKVSEQAKALALSPKVLSAKVLSALEELYGRKPIPFQTINFWTRSRQAAHSDALHFNTMPPGYMCGVWTALEDMDNGPLEFYPGSHKLPMVMMQDVGVRVDHEDYRYYELNSRDDRS